ncbi:segregation/condensation protein A [Sedimentisphaerales bacterium M17dextr]|uniref:Segregation and condensation protein A n=1 Tax=Anaerobaca lacustris TaxID=3044600 RepID=A0AAW6TYJ2_9BACT|nr:segregation/condensation protein A [Sedimentisphaerales bacterium M17dextr]
MVRKEEVDIYDIPLAKITDQYLRYVEILKQFDIDLAGDFLVMAATLMEIKSAMLLPKAAPEEMTAEEASDPRAELIRQLLEYKKFKDAANLLDAAAEQHQERYGRPTSLIDRLAPDAEPEVDMDQVSIWDLLEAFDTVCKAIGNTVYTGHIKDDTPIDLYQIEILHRLQTEGPMTFERVFDTRPNRLVMVGLFLALLELIRDKLIWAEQSETAANQIYLRALTDEPAEQAVQRAILSVAEEEPETPDESLAPSDSEPPRKPAIPIEELPARPNRPALQPEDPDTLQAAEQAAGESAAELPIPVLELPARKDPPAERPQEAPTVETQPPSPADRL